MEPYLSLLVPRSTPAENNDIQLLDKSNLYSPVPTNSPYYYYKEISINATWNDSLECCYDQALNTTVRETKADVNDTVLYPLALKVCIAISYNFIFFLALFGNAMVCYVVFSSPRMRTVTNYLIANLAVGDLLMAVLCVQFAYIPVLLQYWPFGRFLCYLLSPAQTITVLVSSYTLVALAADRYIAILYPLRPRLRKSQVCWVILVVWVVAIVTASPTAIFTEYVPDNITGHYLCDESGWTTMGAEKFRLPYSLALMIMQYFFPLTVLIFTYSRIAIAVWGNKSVGEAEDSHHERLAKTKRKMIKMMLTVVVVYTVSWLPINIFLVYRDVWGDAFYVENSQLASFLFPVIHWLAMAHSVWNPLIYCYMNSRFRDGFKLAIGNVPCVRKLALFCHCNLSVGPRRYSSYTGHTRENSKRRRKSSAVSALGNNLAARARTGSLQPNCTMSPAQANGVPAPRYPISKHMSIMNGKTAPVNVPDIKPVTCVRNGKDLVELKQRVRARTTRFRSREYSSNSSSDYTTGTTSSSSLYSLNRRQSEKFNPGRRLSEEPALNDVLQTVVQNNGTSDHGGSTSYVTLLGKHIVTAALNPTPVDTSGSKLGRKVFRRQYSESFI